MTDQLSYSEYTPGELPAPEAESPTPAPLPKTVSRSNPIFLNDPKGENLYPIYSKEKADQLLSSGWTLESQEQQVDRITTDTIREMPVASRLAAGAGQFTNQLLLGVPQLIYENTGTEEDQQRKRAIAKALAEEHPVLNIAGGAAGLATSLLGPGAIGLAGKTAASLGDVGVNAVTRAATAAGPKAAALVSNKVAQTAVKAGIENAALTLPYRITEEALGDPNIASEGILAGSAKDFLLGAGLGGGISTAESLIPMVVKGASKAAQGLKPAWFKEQANKFQMKQAGLLTSDIRKLEDYTHKLTFPEQIQSFVDDLDELVPEGQWKGPEATAQALQEARKSAGAELTKIRAIVDQGAGESIPFATIDDALSGVKEQYSKGSLKVSAKPGKLPERIELTGEQYQDLVKRYGDNPTNWPPEAVGGTAGSPAMNIVDQSRSLDTKAISYVQDSFKAAAVRKMEEAGAHPEEIAEALRTGEGLPNFSVSELHDLRQAVKEKLYAEERVSGIKTNGGNDAFKAIGSVMDDAINSYAESSGNTALIDAFSKANDRYHKIKQMLKIVEPGAERAIARNKVGLGSTIWTGGGYIAGGQAGALAGLAAGYVKQHYGNFLAQKAMGTMAKVLESMPSEVGAAVGDMLSPRITSTLKAAGTGSVALLSRYAGEEAKDEEQAAKALLKDLAYAQSSPEKTSEVLDEITGGLSEYAPKNFALMGAGVQNAIQYLQREAPKPPPPLFPGGPTPQWKMSPNDLSKWTRKVQAVFNPMSILKEVRTGTLSRESVDAFKTVYPNLYTAVQSELKRRLNAASPDQVKKIMPKLSLLVDSTLDPQQNAMRIQTLQAGFAPDNSKKKPKANSKIDEAGRYQTDLSRVVE